MRNLRQHLVRLGSQKPALRPHIRPILASLGAEVARPVKVAGKAPRRGRKTAASLYSPRFLNKHRGINIADDPHWDNAIIVEWQKELDSMGFEDIDINFGRIGDSGGYVFLEDWEGPLDAILAMSNLKAKYRDLYDYVSREDMWAIVNGRKFYTMSDDLDGPELPPEVQKQKEAFEKEMTKRLHDLTKAILHELQMGYGHLTSDEAVADTLEANGIFED
jgi:hypothetical protein